MGDDPDSELVDRLRAGDEDAFVALAGNTGLSCCRWRWAMRRAGRWRRKWSRTPGWEYSAVLAASSAVHVRTWLIRIVINRAVSAAARDAGAYR